MATGLSELAGAVSGVNLGEPAQPVPAVEDLGRGVRRKDVLRRLARLKAEGLQLYRPLPHLTNFHASPATWRMLVGSNRSSKSLTGAAEACRAWCGCDPYDKYPKRNGNSLVVGLQLDHIAMLWRKCAEEGAFKVIRDEHTRLWRTVRPNPQNPLELDAYDLAYQEKWRDAPPLIPPRMIITKAMESPAKGIPRFVRFATGWMALFRSSDSKSPQGDHYNLGFLDEEIVNQAFVVELIRGIVALDEPVHQRPKAIWSATGQTTNPELQEFCDKAAAGSQRHQAFWCFIKDNAYVPEEEKQAFHDDLSEDERRVRYYGEFALAGKRCYPTYDPQGIHGCEPFEIPPLWCRYVCLDPATKRLGTAFLTVDPDEKHVWIYDSFALHQAGANAWAAEVAKREGEERFEAFVIDQRMGKQHPPPKDPLNVAEQYWAALQRAGVRPRQEGPLGGFFPGSDDIPAREEAVRGWLHIRVSGPFAGTPKLQVFRGCNPEFDKEMRYACMDSRNPKKRATREEDVLVCGEYLAAFDPRYYEPELVNKATEDPVWTAFREHDRRRRTRRGGQQSFGPPLEVG